ncbi:MAG: AAA family ATPase [Methylococcaceae bacterium]|nr:AAA family ATPase [Methylococcaceae bacterium]
MRFNRLDLIKYGKFSDHSVTFPHAKQDFHLIIGPNEAGKSTLRSAIIDLLFGIPARSVHSFQHPLNELRLGAAISSHAEALEFQRTKANKQTLRSPQDAILADDVLTPFLGAADRSFYDQMFGLDHTRLVSGGNSILSAENDVGQILFQSAAGVASLGHIRDALLAEADALWASRKSNQRAYYQAAEQLDKANDELKAATVRTKVWVETSSKVDALQEALNSERQRHQQLQSQRSRLERIRRLAPFLISLRENEQHRVQLGEVIDLPIDAAATLACAERELAIAQQRLDLHAAEVSKITEALDAIVVDEPVLEIAAEITALDNLRLQYRAYTHDIGNRKSEIATLWQDVCHACRQLNWPADAQEAVARRLPTLLVRRELSRLLRERGGIVETLRAAERAEKSKRSEIDALTNQLKALQTVDVKPALRAALLSAKALGDTENTQKMLLTRLNKANLALESSLVELGPWRQPLPVLMALQLPSQEMLNRLLQERQTLSAEHKTVLQNEQKQIAQLARLELQITQFNALHQPTTCEAVNAVRLERDKSWRAIKSGTHDLQHAAQQFEELILGADQIADRRLEDVEEATELQSLSHQLEREQQNLTLLNAQRAQLHHDQQQFDERWAQQAQALNLTGMSLEEIGAWIGKREKTLSAAALSQEVQDELASLAQLLAATRDKLAKSLFEAGLDVADADHLSILCIQAESHIQTIDSAKVRHDTLSTQLNSAQHYTDTLKQATEDAKRQQNRWQEDWSNALANVGLAATTDSGTAEGALELIDLIEEKLVKIRHIQTERIDTMTADLKVFALEANRLAQGLAAELNDQSAELIAQTLATRLTSARTSFTEYQRLKEALHVANTQVLDAKAAIQTAIASLQPLMTRACVDSTSLLDALIIRSDARRRLEAEIVEAKTQLLSGGDGLTQLQIEAEIDAADLRLLTAELTRINDELSETVKQQTSLSAEHATAQKVLSDIGGSDAAMQAEARRQEALAQMSDVAERYIKVFTAGRLLRWAIDRYREEKQGPLLQRAGAIFATLTSGSFSKLIVDFEQEPMVLEGLRHAGKPVGISGMSDGTRDQLYLALRLAALEMHLEQAMPLPFIADDLFINYDDVRSKAGFEALKVISEHTQVIFLSHHDHLIPMVQEVFGQQVNVVLL